MIEPECYPVLTTAVDFSTVSKVYKHHVGTGFTRTIDQMNVSLSDPAALTLALDKSEGSKRVSYFGFLIKFPMRRINELVVWCPLTFLPIYNDDDITLGLLCGNVHQWETAIKLGTKDERSYEVRKLFNKCLAVFETTNFKKVFSFKKEPLKDDTFRVV